METCMYVPLKFKPYELVDKNTYMNHGDDSYSLIDERLLKFLDGLSTSLELTFKKRIRLICNNWYWHKNPKASDYFQWRGLRTKGYKLYRETSYHSKGKAVDIDSPDMYSSNLINYVLDHQDEAWCKDIGGVEIGVNWLHADLRIRGKDNLIIKFRP